MKIVHESTSTKFCDVSVSRTNQENSFEYHFAGFGWFQFLFGALRLIAHWSRAPARESWSILALLSAASQRAMNSFLV